MTQSQTDQVLPKHLWILSIPPTKFREVFVTFIFLQQSQTDIFSEILLHWGHMYVIWALIHLGLTLLMESMGCTSSMALISSFSFFLASVAFAALALWEMSECLDAWTQMRKLQDGQSTNSIFWQLTYWSGLGMVRPGTGGIALPASSHHPRHLLCRATHLNWPDNIKFSILD